MLLQKKSSSEIVLLQTDIINKDIAYRQRTGWEVACKAVHLSYMGNKFPVREVRRIDGTTVMDQLYIAQSTQDLVYINMIKRQHRIIANYLMNNEPHPVITKGTGDATEADIIQMRTLIDNVFSGDLDLGDGIPFSDSFYNSYMDQAIFYGLMRGYCVTLSYFDETKKQVMFRQFDPMDCYFALNIQSLYDAKAFLFTYIKNKEEMKAEFPKDFEGNEINWDELPSDNLRSDSPYKPIMILEPQEKNVHLIREGWYNEYEDGKWVVYRVLTNQNRLLKKDKIDGLTFLPLSFYIPMEAPGILKPRPWYSDMIEIDREINRTIQKIAKIANTQGRYIYLKKGTKIGKAANQVMNSLGIEVFELDNLQSVPQQAQFVNITADLMNYLQFMMDQAQQEGGMMNEIMGIQTNTDQSGRAIQAIQAGSKNNIGQALEQLNKYMTHLAKVVRKLYEIYGDEMKMYSKELDGDLPINKERLRKVQIKMTVQASNAFDEITKQAQAIQFLDLLAKFNPEIKLQPETLTRIMSITNDYVTDIQKDIDKQQDPDMVIADAENKKMIQGQQFNANKTDNHEVHMALHTEMLKGIDPNSPVAALIMSHIKMHEAFLRTAQATPPPTGQQFGQQVANPPVQKTPQSPGI